MTIRTKRAYAPPAPSDGKRYLIDRLWPRGVTRERLALEEWLRELAPSDGLRAWFGHAPEKYPAFRRRYRAELRHHPEILARILEESRSGTVTLIYAARDSDLSNASVLHELLEEMEEPSSAGPRGRTGIPRGGRRPPTGTGSLRAPRHASRARRARSPREAP